MSRTAGKKRKKNFSHAPEKINYPGPRIYGYADKVQNLQGRKKLISYQMPSVNADKEIKVIQAVILREKHKSILMERVSKHKCFCVDLPTGKELIDEETLHAIQDLQVSTIKMLESIESWRLELTRTYPFMWEQKNYVQSLARDMDIVYFNKAMKQYLRRGSKKNPFLTPKLQLNELYSILCTTVIAKITKIDNNENRKAIEQVDNVMKMFAPEITPLRLRDAIKMILEEQETWGPADGVMIAPVWAAEAQEARNRLVGGGKPPKKNNKKNEKKSLASISIGKRSSLYKQKLKLEKPKQKPYSEPYKFALKIRKHYFIFVVQDVSAGKTKVNAYDIQSNKRHELFISRSELKKAFSGRPNVMKQLKNKKRKYRIIVENLNISRTNVLCFDYNRVRNLIFKKAKKNTGKTHLVQYCTYKAAVKIGYFWCTIIFKFLPTMKQSQIIICPLLYPHIKQLLKIKDEIMDVIRNTIILQRKNQQQIQKKINNVIADNKNKSTMKGKQQLKNNTNDSTKSKRKKKKRRKADGDNNEKTKKTTTLTPATSAIILSNDDAANANDDHIANVSLKKVDDLDIIKVFLFECLICAGSPPVFFVQEPFTSRPNTRVREQIEQIEAGIPFYSRPSTREIYTPTLVQNFVVPEDGIMHENIPLRPPQISRELENVYRTNTADSMTPPLKGFEEQRLDIPGKDGNAKEQPHEYIHSASISDIYYVRYAMRLLNGTMYLIHMYTDIFSENKRTVSLRMYPIVSKKENGKKKVQKQSSQSSSSNSGDLFFSFDRLAVEKLYVNDDNYKNDFEEGRDGLLKLSSLLRNHLNVIKNNHVILENLRILKTPEHLKKPKKVSKKFIHDRNGVQIPQQPPMQKKNTASSEKQRSKKRKLDMQLMPIFKPMLARQLSAEGHKRAKRPYTANTWRDYQHTARTFLRKLAAEAKARLIQEAITDEHVGRQSYAKYWLTQKAKEAMIHVRRREKAKKKLISYVSAERERLHRNILKNTTERQDKTDQGTTVMTITKIK